MSGPNRAFCHGDGRQAVPSYTDDSGGAVVSPGQAKPASEQGERRMSRREIFSAAAPASGAVLATALAHVPALAATSPETVDAVFALIEEESDAWKRFDKACGDTDSVVLGREPTDDETAEYEAANQAQEDALARVMEAKASTPAGLIAMIDRFELRELENVSAPVDELLSALLQSVRRFVAQSGDLHGLRAPASDAPVPRHVLDAYDEWLAVERNFLKFERYGAKGREKNTDPRFEVVWRNRETGETWDFTPCNRVKGYGFGRDGDSPSSRASFILAAAGVSPRTDW